jgi:hypothetical protein
LNKSGLGLREILEFHDTAQGADSARPGDADCFTVDSPPKLVGRVPQSYALCFERDHLSRIEAVVRLAAEDAERVFDHACAVWLESSTPAAGTGERCEGSSGHIAFRAHLQTQDADALLTMTLQAEPEGQRVSDDSTQP